MKREYFGMIFTVVFVSLLFLGYYIFDEKTITDYLSSFIVVWVLAGFYAGQYSMKFPKAF
jgi:hypothetical protein